MVVIDTDLGLSHLHNFVFGYNIFQWLAILIRYLNELSLADLIYLPSFLGIYRNGML